jgi:MFS transporter, CP family, cyanate transporter
VSALTMIVLRSGTIDLTASLSTHVQSIGYLLAAAGPLAMGALHDATGSWTASILVLIVLIAAQALTGAEAGRARVLRGRTAPASA